MIAPTPQMVIHHFTLLTGIRIRIASHGQEAQAIDFCKHFTLEELSAVIGYVQKQIQAGKLDERSLSWRNVFGEYGSGNEFASFQDRLSFANKEVRTRPVHQPRPVTRRVSNVDTVTVVDFSPPPEPPSADIGLEVAKQLAEFRKSMGGAA